MNTQWTPKQIPSDPTDPSEVEWELQRDGLTTKATSVVSYQEGSGIPITSACTVFDPSVDSHRLGLHHVVFHHVEGEHDHSMCITQLCEKLDRLDELFRLLAQLDDTKFSVRVKIASSHSLARRLTLESPEVIRIIELVRLHPEWDRKILARIQEVTSRDSGSTPPSRDSKSPWDVTIYALLLILESVKSLLLKQGIKVVTGSNAHPDGLFWARQNKARPDFTTSDEVPDSTKRS